MRRPGAAVAAVAISVALGLCLRLAAARGELWYDEVWSLDLAGRAGGAWGVFTRIHHDNNHHLNTLWLLMVGPDAPVLLQRALAVAAGTLAIPLAAALAHRAGRAEAALAAALSAVSFPLVQYGSEARGYALSVLASLLLGTLAASSAAGARHAMAKPAAWAAAIAGTLSHLTSLTAWVGVAATVGAGPRGEAPLLRDAARRVREVASWLLLPGVALVALAAVSLRGMVVGGGAPRGPLDVLVAACSLAAGGPDRGPLAWPAAAAAVGAGTAGLAVLARRHDPSWRFVAATCAAGVLALLTWGARNAFLDPRYLLLPMAFAPVPFAVAACAAWRTWPRARAAVAAAVAALAACHVARDAELAIVGRGEPSAIARAILEGSPGEGPVVVGGDSDMPNRLLLAHGSRGLAGASRLRYVDRGTWPPEGPDWVVTIEPDEDAVPAPELPTRSGRARWVLAAWTPHAGLSGWTWCAYRRELPARPAPGP